MNIEQKPTQADGIRLPIVEDRNKVAQAFFSALHYDLHKEPSGLLEDVDVFVDERLRTQSYGTALVKEAIARIKRSGCSKLIATSRTERVHRHEWCERLGFSKHGVEFRLNF